MSDIDKISGIRLPLGILLAPGADTQKQGCWLNGNLLSMVKSLGGHIPNTSPGFIDGFSSRCQQSGDGQLQPQDSMALYLGAVLSPSVGLRWPCCSRASEKKCTGKAWHTVGLQCVCVTVSPFSGVLLLTSAIALPPFIK